ncbi:hypothetical protein H0H92_000837 [Tricholoma furcatifolium]|nr:hypothetical protein H0H92_000837 [Tricholoma furcatifolium]
MSSNKRKRDNKPQFIFHDNPTELPPTPFELTRHLEISASQHGLSARRTTLEVPVDPLTLSTSSLNVSQTWNTPDGVEACWDPSDGSELFSFERIDPSYEEDSSNASIIPSRRQRTTAMDHPLLTWIPAIDSYVHEMLRHEGLGGARPQCSLSTAHDSRALYRCRDCFVTALFCANCIRQAHLVNPLHRVQEWKGGFFERTALVKIGLVVPLGHSAGDPCQNVAPVEIVVLHTNGIHNDRYSAFLRMVREWRHIRMLKRAGRGHAVSGVNGTAPGECAVVCPACPYPGINLPLDYEQAPAEKAWLYSLFVGIDANFRLKRLKVSTEVNDPGLNKGYAFCVETNQFKKHLQDYGEAIQDDISTCNNHDAIKSASIRGGKGIDASGVGKTECARHDMKRPVSVGDLQKGERYVNMDYFFLSSIAHNSPRRIVVSYDIACQWARHLRRRASIYADKTLNNRQLVYLVPKFHLQAHRQECQVQFSFNFLRHVGRTDGEAPERGWAAVNAVANSTKEMGPGSRRDTLDDHFGDYNWRKIMTFATTLRRKAEEAIKYRIDQTLAFEQFTAGLPEQYTEQWRQLVEAWERDGNSNNPFAPKVEKISENAVRLELALEDEARLLAPLTSVLHDDVSPSRLIAQGLELEEQQRILRLDVSELGGHSTDLQRSKLIERSNRLFRRIEAWMSIQVLYLPQVAAIRTRAEFAAAGSDEIPSAATVDLFLPSTLIQKAAPCDEQYIDYEWRLRFAQAHGTLREIRRAIITRSQMWKSKNTLVRGQRLHTRSLALIASVNTRIDRARDKYNRIHTALVTLGSRLSKVGWDAELRPLTKDDTVGITAVEAETSEGRRAMSWIWRTSGGVDVMDEEAKEEALRIEWCRTRARAHRWQEECLLLNEEMRRVLAFFEFKGHEWTCRAAATYTHVDPVTAEGLQAYARRQHRLCHVLVAHCREVWDGLSSKLLAVEFITSKDLVAVGDLVADDRDP